MTYVFYAPNFEEVEGAYWFEHVRLSVCPPVSLSVTLSCGHDILRTIKNVKLIFGIRYPYHMGMC